MIGNTDTGDFGDLFMQIQCFLNRTRIYVIAAAQNDILQAINKESISLIILISDIAGSEPSVDEGILCCGVVLSVTRHDLCTANADFAFLADRHGLGRVGK